MYRLFKKHMLKIIVVVLFFIAGFTSAQDSGDTLEQGFKES